MCKTKDEASTKLDKLIATMERLAIAVEVSNAANAGPIRIRWDNDDKWVPLPEVATRA